MGTAPPYRAAGESAIILIMILVFNFIQCAPPPRRGRKRKVRMFVSEAPAGASFKVKRVVLGKEVGKRLADMGFTEGAEGAVVRGGFLRGLF